MHAFTHRYPLLLAFAIVFAPPSLAQEQTRSVIRVANNGTDTPTCGTRIKPCRSISFGIVNAQDGDLVLVGPGHYGDIDGDLQYTTSGDEMANLGLGCVICIQKSVSVASTDGAKVTVIDRAAFEPPPGAIRPPELRSTVLISASGVSLGGNGSGFTIYGHSATAVRVEAAQGDIRVIGNVALNGGFALFPGNGPLFAAQNTVRNTDIGMQATSDSQVVVVDNFAEGNSATGFSITGLGQHRLARNTAIANQVGFFLGEGRYSITSNVASANEFGFVTHDSGHIFSRNTAVGNDVGFNFNDDTPPTVSNSFHTNNMIGNHFCGLSNNSGKRINARNNYWGSRTGPGLKPADAVCNLLSPTGVPSTTIVVPFALSPFEP